METFQHIGDNLRDLTFGYGVLVEGEIVEIVDNTFDAHYLGKLIYRNYCVRYVIIPSDHETRIT